MTRKFQKVYVSVLIFLAVHALIADTTPVKNKESHKTVDDTKVYTFNPIIYMLNSILPASDYKNEESRIPSPNLNTMQCPRRGERVTLTPAGIKIEAEGYLYERLAHGFSNSKNLEGQAFRVQYTAEESHNVKFSLMQKMDTPGTLHLEAFHYENESEAGKRTDLKISLKRFEGADASRSFAFRIEGPVTVHLIELVADNEETSTRPGLQVVDNCKTWNTPIAQPHRSLFAPSERCEISSSKALNLYSVAGGESINMKGYAFKVVYSSKKVAKTQVEVMHEQWDNDSMKVRSYVDSVRFDKGKSRTLFVRVPQLDHVSGINIHGSLSIHSIDIVALSPDGSVPSGH